MRFRYDVIIAGSGISGLHAALCLDQSLSVLVITKSDPELNNSALAQGGVAAVLDRSQDNEELHFEDTMIAGGQTNNSETVRVLVEDGPENVLGLLKYGVNFDKSPDGSLNLTLEGGHSRRRIAHYRDTTGYEIETKLLAAVEARENIDLLSRATLLRLERDDSGFCAGVLVGSSIVTLRCGAFILATGGVGRLFKYTTNSAIATGDGIHLAGLLGARLKNLSLIQFHPTAFAGQPVQQRFLISESVRGEGALLLNPNGERFMHHYDSRLELAPRDVVSKAIRSEALKLGSEDFSLDITAKGAEYLQNRFPAIYQKCLEYGVDITKDKIPVFPCQHYLMGGIDVDACARTTVPGLYAVGECSHTGVHGNNRLASNSLLEALVFSKRAANDIMDKIGNHNGDLLNDSFEFKLKSGTEVPAGLVTEIQNIMQESFFIIPDKAVSAKNLPRIQQIGAELMSNKLADGASLMEARSLCDIAGIILTEVSKQ